MTESSNQDALSGSSDLLELLLQEDSRSGTGSAASGSLGSGLGSGSGSGSHEGGSTSASITRECSPASQTPPAQLRTVTGALGGQAPALAELSGPSELQHGLEGGLGRPWGWGTGLTLAAAPAPPFHRQ